MTIKIQAAAIFLGVKKLSIRCTVEDMTSDLLLDELTLLNLQ